jgi:hypothetical protein
MKWILHIALTLILSLVISCQKEFSCPLGFARLAGHEWKALSPQGSVMKYHIIDEKTQAQSGFWSEAIFTHFRNEGYQDLKLKSYSLGKKDSIRTQSFIYPMQKSDYVYFVALIIKDKKIHLWEVTGPYSDMKNLSPNLIKKIQDFY